ncbi:MAG: metal-dependent transcriptional regulator [Anaerolineae bacterium]|nr:metal-dependent transcriptional regulator [Anaerolineae bacterium]MCA9909231.1 metal-dependent transcriptional regulator [Anaerolineae bacterium]
MENSGKTRNEDLSDTMRTYLAAIYRLDDHEGEDSIYVSTSALADVLDVSAPAVNRMVTKLREAGYLVHEPYQGIHLTESGVREALLQLRRHRLVEAFLVNVMGFGWHEVHEEASRMSQRLSDVMEQRMAEMAGNPTTCPHGEPIPDANGHLPPIDDMLLSDAPLKTPLVLSRVRTRERDRLEYLEALGLVPGTTLEVLNVAPFHGPIQLRVGNEYRIIGHNLALMIRVKHDET